jgi:hypothetical protein
MQLSNAVLALTHVLGKVSPELTQGYMGMALHSSAQSGNGDLILKTIWEKAFPGAPLPVALSPEEFAEKVKTVKP